ncbi:MAG: YebC/PmpR family DNA-binding transcriptional regulator [Melioribacteraceae bacterium]|nr:YebC/PmpR family DNA-binding transcriptional regulator [Melioribacteraceae bacterium]
MSGHSKWSTIKRKKGALDAKRGKIFTKLIKEITVAARSGGGDVNSNPRLRLAVDNAKSQNMPSDNITRAIKKATGEMEGVQFLELNYEGYAPAGVAVYVEAVTDNKNRTVAEVRHIFNKYGGSMGESGSVAWMFNHKGVITLAEQEKSEDDILELVMETGAEDVVLEDGYFTVSSEIDAFEPTRKAIVDSGLEVENASLQWIAENEIDVSGEEAEKVIRLIDMLEDCDDVQNVYSNANFVDM